MTIIEGWMPPSRENYDLILKVWQISYPIIGSAQWIIGWYGMGKTSVNSRLNLPGRIGWLTMEAPGVMTLLYLMKTMPVLHGIDDLPWQNTVLAALFAIHYSYRAVMFPFLQPSMSPLHIGVWLMALGFQLLNATCMGSWLAAYGPVTEEAWASQSSILQFAVGIIVFYLGLSSNFYHDEELRDIRRREQSRQERIRLETGKSAGIDKHYQIPQAGLFRYMLYPHYLCEWVEWSGFWMAAGWGSVPARTFLINEVVTMVPRAVRGKWWYVERFGEDKIGKKWAVIPGVW
ncbi:3-oxo-5-alpha-steroid 4-dehydrogenase-domain-containing protein [Dactylonectria estremocensis]|uniref:3-oxo-5-alpha-steroid 4-dehydrogenase-domain-containing protein n=1 Tax=Dactylonectria estremocensis TaxID=1079267 RepID=A0A9P9E986_9HYPO|nr:3-oxo-5-alpha-steroid 4-dehydrogenase-domain-containing protein [Dactylonectria estremocensis]